jgi:hypothetical protein
MEYVSEIKGKMRLRLETKRFGKPDECKTRPRNEQQGREKSKSNVCPAFNPGWKES